MEKLRVLVFFLFIVFGLNSLAFGCRSSSTTETPKRQTILSTPEDDYENEDDLEVEEEDIMEDEEDETVDDIALDDEDFDLMCEYHEKLERFQRKPDFIIIGSKKGGTRALIEFLKLHPSIKAAGPEIHFFDNKANYDKGLDWYISRMPSVQNGRLITEKTPGYFHTPKVPRRIKVRPS